MRRSAGHVEAEKCLWRRDGRIEGRGLELESPGVHAGALEHIAHRVDQPWTGDLHR